MRNREFTAPNGEKRSFWFRDGTNDESTIIACFEEDYYKVLSVDFQNNDVILDLGAHVGSVALLANTIPDKALKIITVEVLPENFDLISKNITEQSANIKTYQRAIWHEGGLEMNVSYQDNGTENGKVHNFMGMVMTEPTTLNTVKVKTITIEDIFKENGIEKCKLLKVDIEGAEEKIFATMPKDVLDKIEIITGEYHNADFDSFFPFKDDFDIERKDYGYFLCRRKNA